MFRKIKHPNEYKTFKYKSITKTPPRTDQMTQSNQQNTKYRVQSIWKSKSIRLVLAVFVSTFL